MRSTDEDGQASLELVAAIPLLLALLALIGQLAIAGYSLWSAGAAARAGARAAYVGGDSTDAAMGALPPSLRDRAEVDSSDGVAVRVQAPALLPGAPDLPVTARTALGAGAGDEG